MMNKAFMVPLLILAMSVQGCGSSVLIKQETTSTVSAGKNAISEINKFNAYVFDTQNKLAASLIARYPSCKFGDSIVIRTSYSSDSQKKLCLSDTEIRSWQSTPPNIRDSIGKKIELTPLERSSLKSSMDILEAFSKYLDAMAKHTIAPETPISGTLEGVISDLHAINAKVKFLPDAVSSKSAQSAAVTSFIKYLEDLKGQHSDANQIKNTIASKGEEQENNLLAIANDSDKIYATYVASMSATLTTTLGDYYNKNIASKEFETLEKRQAFLTEIFKQKQLENQIQTTPSPGGTAIREFVAAHKKLRNAISGNYSEEQRAFIVDENIKELRSGLQGLAGLIQFAISAGI